LHYGFPIFFYNILESSLFFPVHFSAMAIH